MVGVNHLFISRLDLHFKILSEVLVADLGGGVNYLSISSLDLHFQNLSELLVADLGGQSSFVVVTFKFKIIPETLDSDNGGVGESPNLPVSKSASRFSDCHQICQSENPPAEIERESSGRFTKSASQQICWGECAGRLTKSASP